MAERRTYELWYGGDTINTRVYQNDPKGEAGVPIVKIWLPKKGYPKRERITVTVKIPKNDI